MNGKNRSDVFPGLEVDIVLKKDQRTGKTTRGIVKDLPNGIEEQGTYEELVAKGGIFAGLHHA